VAGVIAQELPPDVDVPAMYLALALIGVPLAATAAGWLLAGREPPVIARRVIE